MDIKASNEYIEMNPFLDAGIFWKNCFRFIYLAYTYFILLIAYVIYLGAVLFPGPIDSK